ncbi:MAG: RluA family pseudouridine synthase [Patescibacteria group bacterium]|jgi:23S rRNA pseudouridine1911/1915/1917 synthase
MKNKVFINFDNSHSKRADAFLADKYPEYSRAYFQNLITSGKVFVNGEQIKPSHKLISSDLIEIDFIESSAEYDLKPADIKLDILFENDDVIVINKQPGLVVHPAAGNKEGTLVNALIYHFPMIKKAVYDKNSEVSKIRPGLVHRLDKDTSGVLIVAKNTKAMHSLSRQIQNRNVVKKYWALCFGWPKNEKGVLINYLGRHPKNRKLIADVGETKGKQAISNFCLIHSYRHLKEQISLIEFDIKTGRTHQIRVQAKEMGNPVMGDAVYGNKSSITLSHELNIQRQMLHAKELSITLPGDAKARTFSAPIPDDFQSVIDKLS